MNFHDYSKQIVEDYLGTVAYVDDLIFSGNEELKPKKLGNIDIKKVSAEKEKSDKSIPEKNERESPKRQLNPNIDPNKFTNAFLEKGIHCALLEITKDDDPLEPIKGILKKSDVVILDWQMHGDLGKKATELLVSVATESSKPELKLVIIFTNYPKYSTIIPEVINPELEKKGITDVKVDKSNCSALFGHTKIVVLEKENGKKTETTISDDELPDRIIEEFTEITKGLISNTALKAITVIRRNSHNLLGVFNNNLDSGYLTHRAFLENPIESELHIIEWFADEIRDLLFVNNVSSEVNFEKISLVIDSLKKEVFDIYDATGKLQKQIENKLMLNLLELGCKNYNTQFGEKVHNIPQKWYNNFYKTFGENTNEYVNEKLAILSSLSLSSFNYDLEQTLTLGTIVKINEDFLLCIQPSCDSVRLEKPTNFIFLRLLVSEKPFDFVVPLKKKFQKLKISYKPDDFIILRFSPDNGIIRSFSERDEKFYEDINGNRYLWIANLKHQFSQRISNIFAAEISRVGLNESEWLRRSANNA